MPLVALEHISHAYGHLPLLDDAALQVDAGERIAIIGRNGVGKSTLLQIIAGELPPDAGTVWHQPGVRVTRLVQDVPLSTDRTVSEVVGEGLGTLDEHDEWQRQHQADMVMTRLSLPPDVKVDSLSGGWKRRVLLARALVGRPDLLLLDEPTNHLDIEAITWLEQFLADYGGAVIFVTHDRAFLERLATRIVEIDRGRLTSWPGDYATFERKKEEWLANEELQRDKFDKKMAIEEAWLRRGVKARRTRDEGRVKALLAMREERAERRQQAGQVRLQMDAAEQSGKTVIEAERVTFSYPNAPAPVVRDFSTRIMRGDRIGLIGPNGSGKTTLLRLLLGELAPTSGEVRRGANVAIAYYDQQREQLDPDRTVVDTIGDGNDTVTVNGRARHVHGYLQDFLFSPERARSPVRALSGGERNRLLLARLLTRPANVLVLDEPTNDLDLETLELLEQQLVEWPGTLLLVSHDRRFLDNVVTSTMSFAEGGRVEEFVGGYADWLRQSALSREGESTSGNAKSASGNAKNASGSAKDPSRSAKDPSGSAKDPSGSAKSASGNAKNASGNAKDPSGNAKNASGNAKDPSGNAKGSRNATQSSGAVPKPKKKRTFKEEREYVELPSRIAALEQEQKHLQAAIHDPDFYKKPQNEIHAALERVTQIDEELLAAMERWDLLDSIGT